MALDPTIALNADPGVAASGNALGGGSIMQMLGHLAQTQNAVNTNKLFQQTFQAKQRAGELIAGAGGDSEAAIKALMSDPQVAPFAHEIVNGLRTAQQTLVATQGAQATQNKDAFQAIVRATMGGLTDPSQLGGVIQAQMQTLPPEIQSRVRPAVESLVRAWTTGLPGDPTEAMKVLRNRQVGTLFGAGVDTGAIEGAIGKPVQIDTGGGVQMGVQAPTALGGGLIPANRLGKTLAPTVVTGPYGEGGAPTTQVIGGDGASNLGGAPRPPGGPNLTGPSQTQSTYNEHAGTGVAEAEKDYNVASAKLPEVSKRIGMLTDTLEGFQAGGGAEVRAAMGKGLQALRNAGVTGVTPEMIEKVSNGSIKDTQTFQALIRPLVIGELKAAAEGTGRVMRSEVDAFLKMLDTTTDPRTIVDILNQAKYMMSVQYDKAQKWPQFRNGVAAGDKALAGYKLQDFEPWYAKNFNPAELPRANPSGGLNLSGKNPDDVKGGTYTKPESPQRLRWDPRKQDVVPVQ